MLRFLLLFVSNYVEFFVQVGYGVLERRIILGLIDIGIVGVVVVGAAITLRYILRQSRQGNEEIRAVAEVVDQWDDGRMLIKFSSYDGRETRVAVKGDYPVGTLLRIRYLSYDISHCKVSGIYDPENLGGGGS